MKAGADGKFTATLKNLKASKEPRTLSIVADAKVVGNTVVVSSPEVKAPAAVRYAWANNPVGCNLYNSFD